MVEALDSGGRCRISCSRCMMNRRRCRRCIGRRLMDGCSYGSFVVNARGCTTSETCEGAFVTEAVKVRLWTRTGNRECHSADIQDRLKRLEFEL